MKTYDLRLSAPDHDTRRVVAASAAPATGALIGGTALVFKDDAGNTIAEFKQDNILWITVNDGVVNE